MNDVENCLKAKGLPIPYSLGEEDKVECIKNPL
jgi:hypothetical protein